jgi:hypothetical protein
MAIFYLLPARESLNDALGQFLGRLLPGLPLPADTWDAVAERLAESAAWPADVFLIPRDDLPEDGPPDEALVKAFGAEPGDRVIEVGLVRPLRTRLIPTGVYDSVEAR